jgi:spore maturation protein CgeB
MDVRLAIWGYRWDRARSALVRRAVRSGPALETNYAKAICGSKINLCFLSRLARDAVTQRSVEIRACGGFMLAERTSEHLAHFAEGVEAAYFSSPDEMCRLISYYLENEQRRQGIAQAGREKCLKADFSYDSRLREILGVLGV